ncbi:MAG TPA: FG-GAP-like repeat-containing protein [Gaiellaceae bacterium]|nr:FG-GAP-like repeat-containing protein [Gaiellaceae bacterium]
MAAVAIRGTTYPVVLPKLRDPRLHLAATITSLQVLGQVAFHFRLSISQILISLATCALLEVAITVRKQRVLMWPASALLTGNGVAFVLRVVGTRHGDWWTTRGWWIFALTAGGSLLSKYVIAWRGEHVFNPSNIGLVVCFLTLGRNRVEPLDFWWGPMSWWMALALAIIVTGGFTILSRLKLLRVALSFWGAFAVGIGGLALAGHAMTARWHLGPIEGFSFWWILVTSPEVLVFLFFMITDPKTAPRDLRARLAYGTTLGLGASLLIAPTRTEFAAKVALLASLALVCLAQSLLRVVPVRVDRRRFVALGAVGIAAYVAVVVGVNAPGPSTAAAGPIFGRLPPIAILPSPGVQTPLDRPTAQLIARDLIAVHPASPGETLRLHLVPGTDQSPPVAVAQLGADTYRLNVAADGSWSLAGGTTQQVAQAPQSDALAGVSLRNVAPAVGLDFRQDSFRFGISSETKAMMGGGVCWLDYNGDGWLDLFAVNSYSSDDVARWDARGGLPTTALFENDHGRFVNVTRRAHAGLAVQGDGCVAADLNGDGRPDLVVTTTSGVDILWNRADGTFARTSLPANGWYTGAAVADVNGDGRPDLFVAGYADPNDPVPGSFAGFPTNVAGVRDLLFLNEGDGPDGQARFREVGVQAGLEAAGFRHGLGALFTDVNGDGRPDLYVANDEDPNQLYVNVPWPGGAKADPAGLGFRFEERAAAAGVADPFAGMGIADAGGNLFVTNSRGEPSAAFRRTGPGRFANARPAFDRALGTGFAGWGASWVDLANSGSPDLVLTAGAIPVTNLARNAEQVRVLAPAGSDGYGNATRILGPNGLALNGRGLAAADVDNDGRMQVAVNTIGGRLVLLRASGPSGHWLDVRLSRFSPGAVVAAVLPDGRRLARTVQAGSSYLSSEDPRVHLGLGAATRVVRLTVRYPWGGSSRLVNVRADRIVTVAVPRNAAPRPTVVTTARLASCAPASTHGQSVARVWNDAAVAVLRAGDASEPVQARDLYDLSAAVARAYRLAAPPERVAAISYAAYRLLLWRASFLSNLQASFALLERQLRALCYSPEFTSRAGGGAALGNRVAAAAIAAGLHDGSNELLHYADPSYAPQNAPLVVAQSGSTVHDATFWQPLALAQVSPRGSGAVPAQVQTFVGSQWGRVRTFAGKVAVGPPPLGDPGGKAYRDAALAAIRATAGAVPPPAVDPSPAAWNAALDGLRGGSLRRDVQLDLVLNGALNDAAVSAFGAKRRYQSPRPIEMIRYLAFNGELPIVRGLTRPWPPDIQVRLRGRWVSGSAWTPPGATPASPGWPSADAAFAAAANRVLSALTGRSFAERAARAEQLGVDDGTELPADAAEGRRIGARVADMSLKLFRGHVPETVSSR